MNFQVFYNQNGIARTSWEKAEDVTNEIYISLAVTPGQMFYDLLFGLETRDIDVITDENIALIEQRATRSMTKAMVASGLASEVSIIITEDAVDKTRLNAAVKVKQIDGVEMQFEAFIQVAGPSPSYVPPLIP
jgi:hypothetical protein